MKKWYMWFVLSGIWLVATLFHLLENRSGLLIAYSVFATLLLALLGILQFFCDKKGENGKRRMKQIYIAAIILIAIVFASILLISLR